MSFVRRIFLNSNYVLYFAILILIGDVIDIALTYNIRIAQPINFYFFEQNTFVKDYIGTDLWFIPLCISLFFSLLLIYFTYRFSDVILRVVLLYFGLFTYINFISWTIKSNIFLYFHGVYAFIFLICIFIEFKRKKYFKHPSSGQ